MTLRTPIVIGVLLALVFSAYTTLHGEVAVRNRPNILLITLDAVRPDRLGLYGYPVNTTPNLDRFGGEASVFTNAYSHCSWTHPSLASIMTGRHPKDHGVSHWTHVLGDEQLMLAEVLQGEGYHTEAYVSHDLLNGTYGYTQGFDYYDDEILDEGNPHDVVSSPYLTEKILNRSEGFTSPFFVWVHYFDPHFKYTQHPEFDYGSGWHQRYLSELSFTDYRINMLLEGLESKGLLEDTIIVIVADHGEEFQEHGDILHRGTLYEELIRIPLIVKVPGMKAQVVDETVVTSDLAPTLLSLIGVDVPPEFLGDIWERRNGRFTLENKSIYTDVRYRGNKTSMIEGKYKLIINHDRNGFIELFDLESDPGEKDNIASAEVYLAEALKEKLGQYYSVQTEPRSVELSEDSLQLLKDLGYLV